MKKFSKKEIEKLQREHKQYNKEMRQIHCHSLQKTFDEFVAYRFGKSLPTRKKVSTLSQEVPIYQRETEKVSSMNSFGKIGLVTKVKQSNKYTGDLIQGIGVMHKSNAVPVINSNVAKDLATMRR